MHTEDTQQHYSMKCINNIIISQPAMKCINNIIISQPAIPYTLEKKKKNTHFITNRNSKLLVDEINNLFNQCHSILIGGVMQMEAMFLPFILHNLYAPFPPTPLQPLVVGPTWLSEMIIPSHEHQHPLAPNHCQILYGRLHPWVIKPTVSRTHVHPHLIIRFHSPKIRVGQKRPDEFHSG
ncbi:hypothetical protein LOK49_LG05G01829 [Camellia lanceoleosa]|uniref:Uncharacterized protein n=1 Tax=Camellia lanceoleosa TaxID=1840588 RepID=A0ACC0HT74_9ERIC|nr:hypothetical protein LOK49_LG05G01829 [Camellia lanceoleosa]